MVVNKTLPPRVAWVAGAFLLYAVAMVPLIRWQGPAVTTLAALPTAVAGGLLGRRLGVASACVGLILNTLLLQLLGYPGWDTIVRHGEVLSLLRLPLVGFLGGWLRAILEDRQVAHRDIASALRASEHRFRALLLHADEGMAIVDLAGATVYQSPAVARIIGFAPEELIGSSIFARVHPDDLGEARRLLEELARLPGALRTHTPRVRHADGSWRFIEVRGTSLIDEPSVGGIVLNYRDVTERHRADILLTGQAAILEMIARQAPLAESLTALARVIEAIGDETLIGICLLEEDGTMLRNVAAPSLPAPFAAAAARIPVGEGVGSCGTAAFRREAVISADIATDPLWADWAEVARASGLRSCWSLPILVTAEGGEESARLLGTFAVYSSEPRQPGEAGLRVLERSVGLAALAIEQARAADALRASEARFRTLVDNASDIVTVLDTDGTRRYVSPSIGRILGYSPEELLGRNLLDLVHPDDRAAREANLRLASREPGAHLPVVFRIRHRDGSWRDWEAITTSLLDDPGVGGLVINARDVTERVHAERALRRRNEELAALNAIGKALSTLAEPAAILGVIDDVVGLVLGNRNIFIALVDEARREIHFPLYRIDGAPCPPASRPFGRGVADHVLRTKAPLLLPRAVAEACAALGIAPSDQPCRGLLAAPMLVGEEAIGVIAVQDYAREAVYDRGHQDLLVTIAAQGAIALENARLYAALRQELAERRRAEAELARQAYHDPLTGLPNRAFFLERLALALARTKRAERPCAVLFLDLDHFKDVNDSCGHDTGDRLLIAVAERLRRILAADDTLARLGGDEFTVLLDGVGAVAQAAEVAERLAAVLEQPFAIDGQEHRVAASVGIVLGGSGHERPEDVLRDADMAMYRAKSAGRGRYAVFDPALQEGLVARLALERDLRQALARGEFLLHYQPKVDLYTGQVAGVEALVRWRHPQRGLIPPDAFIPLAEETGLIIPLGRWVMGEACGKAAHWAGGDGRAPVLSVNLSARQFQDPTLLETIARALAATGLAPGRLQLEITESSVAMNTEAAAVALWALKGLGVRLALDDFGTGYSSLGSLKGFPLDVLKIDKQFVAGLGHDQRDEAIVGAVIGLGHALGLVVTAEGIETAEQAHQLRAMGCELGQGFYFARPLPAAEIDARLAPATAVAAGLPALAH